MTDLLNLRIGLSSSLRRSARRAEFLLSPKRWAERHHATPLSVCIHEHRLPLVRRLSGVDPLLFENKRINLRLALEKLNGVLIAPGETFSFWRLVGAPTAAKGYLEGLSLAHGRPSKSVGGGLCQLANALFWLSLHSDLRVTERHHHSLDLFPDDDRLVPFGTGATLVYNFKDLRLANPTPATFQFLFEMTPSHLVGRLYASEGMEHTYRIVERDHRFSRRKDGLYRQNTIVREIWNAQQARKESEQVLFKNNSKCRYSLEEVF